MQYNTTQHWSTFKPNPTPGIFVYSFPLVRTRVVYVPMADEAVLTARLNADVMYIICGYVQLSFRCTESEYQANKDVFCNCVGRDTPLALLSVGDQILLKWSTP